jgi:class 3 adenylate cyclase
MDTLGRLQAMAKARQLTLSEAVREAVADWLDNPATLAKSLPEEQREAFLAKAAAAFPPAS